MAQGVKRYFYRDGIGQALQRACQKKRRTCVPHLRNVSMCRRFWARRSVNGQLSRLLDAGVVAIVSNDVTLTKGKISAVKIKEIGDREKLSIISRAFDQIQVFAQMLGGYFRKKNKAQV